MGPSGAVPHAGNWAPVRLPVPGPWKSPGVGPIGLVSVRPDQVVRRDSSEVETRTPATSHGMSCPQCPQSPASCPQLQLRTRKASIHAGFRLIWWVAHSVLSRKRVKLSASAASRSGSVAALPPRGCQISAPLATGTDPQAKFSCAGVLGRGVESGPSGRSAPRVIRAATAQYSTPVHRGLRGEHARKLWPSRNECAGRRIARPARCDPCAWPCVQAAPSWGHSWGQNHMRLRAERAFMRPAANLARA